MHKKSFNSVSWMTPLVGVFTLLALVTTSILTYAQTAKETKFKVWTMKDSTHPAPIIQVQQIREDSGMVKDYCVSGGDGLCTFVMSASDGPTIFLGGIVDSKTGERGENYGGNAGAADPSYDCKVVTFQYDLTAGKVYRYLDGVQDDSAVQYILYPESYYKTKCVANGRGGYDAVSKTSSAGDPSGSSDVDFAILNVVRPRYGKNKRTGIEQLQFEEQLRSDSKVKESVSLRGECFMHTAVGEKVTMALSTGLRNIPPGRYTYKITMPVADEGKELFRQIKAKKGSFTCDFDLPGYFPDELSVMAEPDADMSNNFLRATVQWKGKKLKIVSTTRSR